MQTKNYYLKSTGQQIHLMGWTGQGKSPWPSGYEQVMRQRKPNECLKSGNRGEVMVVKRSNIFTRSALTG